MAAVDGHGAPHDERSAKFKPPARNVVPGRDSAARLTAMRRQQREQDGLTGPDKRRMVGAALASLRALAIGRRGYVIELREWRSGSGRLEGAPVAVIAEIAAGIARHA